MEGERSKGCLENLPKCRAMCCKLVGFKIDENFNPKNRTFIVSARDVSKLRYYKMHEGITVRVIQDKAYVSITNDASYDIIEREGNRIAIFSVPCKNLAKDNSCTIYDLPSRPRICRDGYNRQKTGIVFCPDCIYRMNENVVSIGWDDIKNITKKE